MTTFSWLQYVDPDQRCLTCMSQVSQRGFVDCISEVNVMRDGYEITGIVDVVLCAVCLEQAAGQIGCVSPADAEKFAYQERDSQDEILKLKDEVSAWQERVLTTLALTTDDVADLSALSSTKELQVVSSAGTKPGK